MASAFSVVIISLLLLSICCASKSVRKDLDDDNAATGNLDDDNAATGSRLPVNRPVEYRT
jgi:hypothetical protein